jgi:hypothetical protein
VIKSRIARIGEHVTHMRKGKRACRILIRKPEVKVSDLGVDGKYY